MPPPRGGSIAWLRLVQAGEIGLRSAGGRLEDGAPEAAVGLEEGRGVMGARPERLAPVEDTLDTGVVLGHEVGMTIGLLGDLPPIAARIRLGRVVTGQSPASGRLWRWRREIGLRQRCAVLGAIPQRPAASRVVSPSASEAPKTSQRSLW